MREPGTSFEFEGEVLHVVASTQRKGDDTTAAYCHGCVGFNNHPVCKQLRADCGTMGIGNCVVFVRDVEQFRAEVVAWTLTGNSP